MKTIAAGFALLYLLSLTASAQQAVKFVADSVAVEAEGRFETDPDVATLAFNVFAQEKELKVAYQKVSDATGKIMDVAQKNGIDKDAIHTGVFSVTPFWEGNRNKKARSYRVETQITLRVRDLSKVGPIMDDSVEEGIIDLRSVKYSLADEEAAKQRAVAEAMRRAVGRATVALEATKQKLGPVRSVTVDVAQLVPVQPAQTLQIDGVPLPALGAFRRELASPTPMPAVNPERITVRATVQCVFQIQ